MDCVKQNTREVCVYSTLYKVLISQWKSHQVLTSQWLLDKKHDVESMTQ